jgi:NAD(P)-dependent dehydrogenase (short-subunit alcohol dehydrogenase family)
VEFLPMDLASLKSVKDAADRILAEESVIDILVCNAGVIAEETKLTEDGVETDFQTNYLGMVFSTVNCRALLLDSIVVGGGE